MGADIFAPYLEKCKSRGIHDEYVLCDVRSLPFRRKSFDVVLCLDLLEHLEKEDGARLLQAMEEIARRQVIISTPIGEFEQHSYDGNPYQEHKGSWRPNELESLGYEVRRLGFLVKHGGKRPLAHFFNINIFRPLQLVAWPLAGVFVHFFPRLASGMVATKNLSGQE